MSDVLKLNVNIITNTFIHNESIVANDRKPSRITKKNKIKIKTTTTTTKINNPGWNIFEKQFTK